jgi:hypothetical protein
MSAPHYTRETRISRLIFFTLSINVLQRKEDLLIERETKRFSPEPKISCCYILKNTQKHHCEQLRTLIEKARAEKEYFAMP